MTGTALRSRAWLNLALVAVVLVLVALVWWRPGKEAGETSIGHITDLEPDAIERLTIARQGSDVVELERVEGAWRLTAPRELDADASRVTRLLGIVEAESHARYDVANLELGELGLEEPHAILTVDDTRIAFGDTDPIDERRYVRVGERVHLISDHHFPLVNRGWSGFVDRALVPSGASVAAIELPGVTVRRGDDDDWRIEPDSHEASKEAAQGLVDAWRGARALKVEAAGDADTREAPTAVVTLNDPERTLRFHVTAREPRLELTRADLGVVYHLTQRRAAELLELTAAHADASGDAAAPSAGAADAPAR